MKRNNDSQTTNTKIYFNIFSHAAPTNNNKMYNILVNSTEETHFKTAQMIYCNSFTIVTFFVVSEPTHVKNVRIT